MRALILAMLAAALGLYGSGFGRGHDHVDQTVPEALHAAAGLPAGAGPPPLGMWTVRGDTLSSHGFSDDVPGQPMAREWMVYERCSTVCTRWIARSTQYTVQRTPLRIQGGRWVAVFRISTRGCGTSRRGSQRQALVFSVAHDRRTTRALEINNANFPNCRWSRSVGRTDMPASDRVMWSATLVSTSCRGFPSCRAGVPGESA